MFTTVPYSMFIGYSRAVGLIYHVEFTVCCSQLPWDRCSLVSHVFFSELWANQRWICSMQQNEAYLTGILKCSAISETASRPLVDEAHPSKHHCREDIPGGYCWPKYEQLMAGEGTSPSMYDMSIDNSLGDVRISVSGIDAVLSLTFSYCSIMIHQC